MNNLCWRLLPLENHTASEVFANLFLRENSIATLLESPFPAPQPQLSRYSICAGSPRLNQKGKPQLWTPQVGQILPFLKALLAQKKPKDENERDFLPFQGGWLGWLGYDLAWEIEKLPQLNPDPLPFPVAYWYEPASFAVLDHLQQNLWLAASTQTELEQLQKVWQSRKKKPKTLSPLIQSSPISFLTSQADYEHAVTRAKKYIQIGDIFQTNISLRFQTSTNTSSWEIYRQLQSINPSPFASYWHTPWGAVISCSPERLVQLRGHHAQTRPIAGTRARGSTPCQDELLAEELLTNTKENAEHIMLVDLERNDLGKVCQWGSMEVDELLTIEKYSHVMHLVSNVTGTLSSHLDAIDLIKAMFPGGTITGCPKVRCMEIIEELEPLRRNLFYGSCGYIDYRGNLELNILIRTLLVSSYSVWGQVGAGIVADSDPEKEWQESFHKAEAQLAALGKY